MPGVRAAGQQNHAASKRLHAWPAAKRRPQDAGETLLHIIHALYHYYTIIIACARRHTRACTTAAPKSVLSLAAGRSIAVGALMEREWERTEQTWTKQAQPRTGAATGMPA